MLGENDMGHIAVIGGGAAGAAVFGELLRRDHTATVHWVVNQPSPGRGVAYATDDDSHLLNVRAAGMGLFLDHADDFLKHAHGELGQAQGSDFLPRRLFGDFVQAQIRTQIQLARQQGKAFAVHEAEAVRIDALPDRGYLVSLADGGTLRLDSVVLALGALAPRPLRTVSDDALASGAYRLDPWQPESSPRKPRRVIVIGTGLTAVDTLLSASTRWPGAELVAVSRHGLLPQRHPPLPIAPYPFQRDLNEALLACDGVPAMFRLVREAIAESPDVDWRSVVDGMRAINARLWQNLSTRQRWQFLRHLRWLWEASRHRMAPASAEALQQLRDEGRLQVIGARVLGVDGRGPLELTMRHRSSQMVSTMEADLIIQATGLDTAVAYTEHPLLSQLLRDGLATADALQLGVEATPDGRLIDADGRPQDDLLAIGSLLRGNLWECTAMPEIRTAAHRLAERISQTSAPATAGAAGGGIGA
jgi:uncharacterized NAD(P)/FAD-binding protein YdhS